MKQNLKDLVNRLKANMDLFNLQMQDKPDPSKKGKYQAWKINLHQRLSRITSLVNQVSNNLFKGNILEVTYIMKKGDTVTRKFKSIITDVSQEDFLQFVEFVNNLNKDLNKEIIEILEIKEIPTFIREIPL